MLKEYTVEVITTYKVLVDNGIMEFITDEWKEKYGEIDSVEELIEYAYVDTLLEECSLKSVYGFENLSYDDAVRMFSFYEYDQTCEVVNVEDIDD